MANLLVINGPNLNLLGSREPEHYGSQTLSDLMAEAAITASNLDHQLSSFQSNVEGELIGCIQQSAQTAIDFIIINPAAYAHTSIAIRDALLAVGVPYIELHLSNIFAREPFRQQSYLADRAIGVITGLGAASYQLAVQAAHSHLLER